MKRVITTEEKATARSKKTQFKTLYALTVVCKDEADQEALFERLKDFVNPRKVRVVVS